MNKIKINMVLFEKKNNKKQDLKKCNILNIEKNHPLTNFEILFKKKNTRKIS